MKLLPFTPFKSTPTAESRRAMALQMMNASDEFDVQIIKGLIEIIAMEGPILTSRAFNLYAKKGGIAKLTPTVSKRIMAAPRKALEPKVNSYFCSWALADPGVRLFPERPARTYQRVCARGVK